MAVNIARRECQKYKLNSEETKAYANPMYFDTDGFNTFRSPSCVDTVTKKTVYPLQDVIFEVFADGNAPKTHIDYGDVLTVIKETDQKVYLGGLTQFTLTAKDDYSGVDKIFYSMDSAAYSEYKEPIKIAKEGEYVLQCYSVDHVGNAEGVIYMYIIVDDSNPATKLEVKGDLHENVLSGRSSIHLLASDDYGIKNIYYSLDGGEDHVYKYPLQAANISQGDHVLKYYSIDRLGNQEVIKTYEFYVDKTAPNIVEEIVGKTFVANGREFSSGRSKLKLTTFDNKAGVKEVFYSINDGEFQKYDKPFYLSITKGNLRIKAYAIDNVNNKSVIEEESSTRSISYVDLSGPLLEHGFSEPMFISRDTVFISSKTKILLKARDNESGLGRIDYVINDNSSQTYTEAFSIETEGVHNVSFNGYDNVDNSNKGGFTVVIDNTGPDVFERFSILPQNTQKVNGEVLNVYPSHVMVFLSATDTRVGYDKMFYKINGGAEKPFTGVINSFDTSNKVQHIEIRALDKLGNETKAGIKFTFE
ncbi:MAG: hypothetical protein HC896_02620 [Bacteroidales bacterium]|nr:hypothetical protein [Bacteroidales bacterium]